MKLNLVILATTLSTLFSAVSPAIAQRANDVVQVNSAHVQPDGLLAIGLTQTWNEGINSNMLFISITSFSCQTKTGTIGNVQGNVGIEAIAMQLNQKKFIPEDSLYGQAIAPLCERR